GSEHPGAGRLLLAARRDRLPPVQLARLPARGAEGTAAAEAGREGETGEATEDEALEHGRRELRLDARDRAPRTARRRRSVVLRPRTLTAHAEAARRGRGREDGAPDGDLRRDRRPRARAGRPPCGDRGVRSDGRRPRAPRARAQACGDAVRVPVADPPQPARARTGGPRAHGAVRAREVQHPRDRRFDETARDLVARLRPRGPAAY